MSSKDNLFKLENVCSVISYLYHFDCLSVEFVSQCVIEMVKESNDFVLDPVLLVIEKCAIKIRKDSPKLLKDLISIVKTSFANSQNLNKKSEFILEELDRIRLNKKQNCSFDESLGFLKNWFTNVFIKKNSLIPKSFPMTFELMKETDFSRVNWWMRNIAPEGKLISSHEENQNSIFQSQSPELIQLENLAKSLRITTPIRKSIFKAIMSSTDQKEAIQNIIFMNIPRKQHKEIAVVLVLCCLQESSYNGFYYQVTKGIMNSLKGFSFGVLITLFDNIKKLSEEENLRRINNLSKFISDIFPSSSFGFKVFKALEFDSLNKSQELFLQRTLSLILKGVSLDNIQKHIASLKESEEDNLSFLEEFINYLTSSFLKRNPELAKEINYIAKEVSK